MRIASIISEYNPFHEGHNYHLKRTKELTGSDYIIVIMSGNFTQRGTPAIINKYARTKQALLAGADLVLELPVCFATASAENFAFGAVSILNKLGVVDFLVFGSETGNIDFLKTAASFLLEEPHAYKEKLQNLLKHGFSFPKARAKALADYFPYFDKDFFSHSNNILGIEYCRALNFFNSSIIPMTITRKDNLYHDELLSANGKLSSATAIRNILMKEAVIPYHSSNRLSSQLPVSPAFEILSSHMPENSLKILKENWGISAPITLNDFSLLLKYKLLLEDKNSLVNYADVTPDLADRIYNNLNFYTDFQSFCNLLKTKELTYTRINRSLLHILLNLRKSDYDLFQKSSQNAISNKDYGQYAKILGFRKNSTPLLHEIKTQASIPLISKLSDSIKELDGTALSMLKKDIQTAHIYESIAADKFKRNFQNEFQQQIVII